MLWHEAKSVTENEKHSTRTITNTNLKGNLYVYNMNLLTDMKINHYLSFWNLLFNKKYPKKDLKPLLKYNKIYVYSF